MSKERLSLGKRGEDLAALHLQGSGYRILARNFRGRCGEIDIVAEERGTLVFVEVKARSGTAFGHPLEAVTPHKQQQLARAALEYLARNDQHHRPVRFDVVGVIIDDKLPPVLELVRDAFTLETGAG